MTGSWRYRQRRYKHLKEKPMSRPIEGHEPCHICGEVRPIEVLATEEHKTILPGSNEKVLEKVRYCSDKAECAAAAPTFSFINPPKSVALRQRQSRGMGQ